MFLGQAIYVLGARLAELMSIDSPEDFGPDRAIHAALSEGHLRWAA